MFQHSFTTSVMDTAWQSWPTGQRHTPAMLSNLSSAPCTMQRSNYPPVNEERRASNVTLSAARSLAVG